MAGQSSLCMGMKACLNSARNASRTAGLPIPLCNPAVASKWMPRRLRAELALVEVGIAPFGVFADKFDVVVTGFRHIGEALLEGQIGPDGPQHDGEREGRICCGCVLRCAHGLGARDGSKLLRWRRCPARIGGD